LAENFCLAMITFI